MKTGTAVKKTKNHVNQFGKMKTIGLAVVMAMMLIILIPIMIAVITGSHLIMGACIPYLSTPAQGGTLLTLPIVGEITYTKCVPNFLNIFLTITGVVFGGLILTEVSL